MKEVLKNSLLASALALTSCEKPEDQVNSSRNKTEVALNKPCNQEVLSSESENKGNSVPEKISISNLGVEEHLKEVAAIFDEKGGKINRLERNFIDSKELPITLYNEFRKSLTNENVRLEKTYENEETGKKTLVKFNLLSDKRVKVDGGDWSFVLGPDDNLNNIPKAAMAILPIANCIVYFENSKTGGEYYFDSGAFNWHCPQEGIIETVTSIKSEPLK